MLNFEHSFSVMKTIKTNFLLIHFNIILPSAAISSKWSLTYRFLELNFGSIFLSPLHAMCPPHTIIFVSIILKIFSEN